jgi:hypothetical protein
MDLSKLKELAEEDGAEFIICNDQIIDLSNKTIEHKQVWYCPKATYIRAKEADVRPTNPDSVSVMNTGSFCIP